MAEPQTAAEALDIWRAGFKARLEQHNPLGSPTGLYEDAERVTRLAGMEGRPLEALVPDETTLTALTAHAEALFDKQLGAEEDEEEQSGSADFDIGHLAIVAISIGLGILVSTYTSDGVGVAVGLIVVGLLFALRMVLELTRAPKAKGG